MGVSPSSETIEFRKKAIEWLNKQDFFWLEDFRTEFGATDADPANIINGRIQAVIKILKRDKFIQCTEFSKSRRQYVILKPITLKDVNL